MSQRRPISPIPPSPKVPSPALSAALTLTLTLTPHTASAQTPPPATGKEAEAPATPFETPAQAERVLNAAETQRLWDELHAALEALGALVGAHNKLPHKTLNPFDADQTSNQKKIDAAVDKLLKQIGGSPLDALVAKRDAITRKIDELEKAVGALEERTFGAPDKGGLFDETKHTLTKQIEKRRAEIEQERAAGAQVMEELRQAFTRLGVALSPQQVSDMFEVVSGAEMRTFFVRFANLRMLSELMGYFLKKTQGGQGYSGQAKKYYAVYVAIVRMLVEIHADVLKRLRETHMTRLTALITESKAQVSSTEALLKDPAQAMSKALLEQNLEVQRRLVGAAESYHAYLGQQAQKVEEALTRLSNLLVAVVNTYETVSLSESLVVAIRAGMKDISELQALALPEMIPLSNEGLQSEFKLVGGQLGDKIDMGQKR